MWNFAIPAAMALMGANNAQRKADAQRQNNKLEAEKHKYSPWTGVTGKIDNSYAPSALEGGLAGGLSGAAAVQGLGLGGMGAQQAAQQAPQNAMAMNQDPTLYGNSLWAQV